MIYSSEDMDNLADILVQELYDSLNASDALDKMLDTDNQYEYDQGMGSLYKVVISRVINKLRIIERL